MCGAEVYKKGSSHLSESIALSFQGRLQRSKLIVGQRVRSVPLGWTHWRRPVGLSKSMTPSAEVDQVASPQLPVVRPVAWKAAVWC